MVASGTSSDDSESSVLSLPPPVDGPTSSQAGPHSSWHAIYMSEILGRSDQSSSLSPPLDDDLTDCSSSLGGSGSGLKSARYDSDTQAVWVFFSVNPHMALIVNRFHSCLA